MKVNRNGVFSPSVCGFVRETAAAMWNGGVSDGAKSCSCNNSVDSFQQAATNCRLHINEVILASGMAAKHHVREAKWAKTAEEKSHHKLFQFPFYGKRKPLGIAAFGCKMT